MERARILLEVTAGMIPGQAEDEYTRQWAITEDEWNTDNPTQILLDRLAIANAYALKLQIDAVTGQPPNWTRTEFIWL